MMESPETIFISIASYRDPELVPTLRDMLRHAAQPHNLHIAICQQDDAATDFFTQAGFTAQGRRRVGDRDVLSLRHRDAHIDVIRVHHYASEGACWARSLAETLFENERYFLQIDSHCRFIPGWDREMIAMLRQLQADCAKPVITAYPPAYTPGENEEASKKTYVSRLIFSKYNPQGIPTLRSMPFDSTIPVRGSYLAGGFIFTTGDFVSSVPNDPQIFFAGEEIAMSVRAFTHGYDIYHPHKPLLWHYYKRETHSKVWNDHSNQAKARGNVEKTWWERDNISKKRVRTVLGLEAETVAGLAPWHHGSVRTLRQFEYQTGLYLQKGTVLPEVLGSEKINFVAAQPVNDSEWLERHYARHKKSVTLSADECSGNDAGENHLHINVYSTTNALLYKRTLAPDELDSLRASSPAEKLILSIEFRTVSQSKPFVIRFCPWSDTSGWGYVTEKTW